MDEEQLRQVYESLMRAMEEEAEQKRILGKVSKDTKQELDSLRAKIQASGVSMRDLTKSVEAVREAEKKREAEREKYVKRMQGDAAMLTKSLGSMAGAAAAGNTSFSVLSGTVTGLSRAIGGLLSAIPVLGTAFDKTAQAIGEGAAFVLDRLDDVADAYSELGKVGAITADGIDGVRKQFNEMGLVGLPEFTEAVKANSVALRALGPTVGQGANVLAKSFGILTKEGGEYRDTLLALGYNTKDIAKISTEIAANQLMMGNRRIKNERDLAKASFEYMKEIDALARATGQSKEAILDEQKKNRLDVAFNEYINDLMKTDPEAAKRLDKYVSSLGGAAAEAARAQLTGLPTTEAAAKSVLLFGDAIRTNVEAVKAGLAPEEARRRTAEAGVRSLDNTFSGLVKLNAGIEELGGPDAVRQIQEWRAQLRAGTLDTEEANKEQKKLTENTPELTKDFIQAQAKVAEFARETQRLGFDFIKPASWAVKKFTETLVDGVKAIRKVLSMPEEGGGGGPGAQANMGGAAARKRREAAAKRAPGGGGGGGGGAAPGTQGLRLKSSEAVAGGETDTRIIQLAHQIQNALGGDLVYFSALNDTYERGGNSKHARGLALDFTIKNPKYSAGTADLVRNILAQSGLNGKVIDEYLNPSKSSTGGHIHVELEAMAKGGITRGPSIAGEAGPEAVVPLPDGKSIPVQMDMQSVVNSIKTELGGIPEGLGKELDQGMIEVLEWAKGTMTEVLGDPKLLKESGVTEEDMKKSLAEAESVLQDWKKQMATGIGPMQGFQEQVVPAMLDKLMSDTSSVFNAQYREAVLNAPEHEELSVNGLTTEGRYSAGPLRTYDTKLTGMIMERLGATDARTRREINLSGIGTNYSMMGADFGSNIGGGMAHAEITDRVASLVESGQPLQEALKTTLAEFQSALQELVKNQSGAEGEGMLTLISQLVDLQRSQNATSERILQVSQN